ASAFIGLMGEVPLAAQTLYFQLSLFLMLFGIAISIGNEILVGHLVGAKRFDDAFTRGFKSTKPLTLQEMPPQLINAFIATE
ncbi:MATE family efflux transporter, partial [Escherichia coli]|nr:MATE family efflux transporter [Escherichia coli]